MLGTVSALVTVEAEARTAVAAALGELADGLAVADLDAAVAALGTLRSGDAGRATLGSSSRRHRRSATPAAVRAMIASSLRKAARGGRKRVQLAIIRGAGEQWRRPPFQGCPGRGGRRPR